MIIFARHGEAQGAKGRAIGQTDLPLSATGIRQAQLLAESFNGFQPEAIYCSPLTRTTQTASYIEKKCSLAAIPCPELKEINLGKWDGLEFAELKNKHPQEYKLRGEDIAGFRPPQGENFNDLKARVLSFLNNMESGGPSVVVTHAGVIRMVLQLTLKFPMENIFKIKPAHCHATVFNKNKTLSLLAYNLPPGLQTTDFIKGMMPNQG